MPDSIVKEPARAAMQTARRALASPEGPRTKAAPAHFPWGILLPTDTDGRNIAPHLFFVKSFVRAVRLSRIPNSKRAHF
jgi:hypothetical protein